MLYGRLLLLALLALAGPVETPAVAQEYGLAHIVIETPWARATPTVVKNGAVYMTIRTAESDRLVAIDTRIAERSRLHSVIIEDDIARMRMIEAIDVVPSAPTVLEPGGLHIMLMGLKAPLVVGERFPLTLTFERAGAIEIEVEVVPLRPPRPVESQRHHLPHAGSAMVGGIGKRYLTPVGSAA